MDRLFVIPGRVKAEDSQPLTPRVTDVEPQANYKLLLAFSNGELRVFDVAPYLEKGVFQALRKREEFEEVYIDGGSIEWPCGAGLHHDTVYLNSDLVGEAEAL